jgi:hypothetical protein
LAVPEISRNDRSKIASLANSCAIAAERRLEKESSVRHRILDLAPASRVNLSRKLEEWWSLDFAAFRAEVKRAFRAEIPVSERGEWEKYLAESAGEVRKFNSEIETAEREIDRNVYRLFDLSPDECALLEASIAGRPS